MRLLLNNSKALLTQKNRIEILHNGADAFASILAALRTAKDHIHLEYYIYEDDEIGNKIALHTHFKKLSALIANTDPFLKKCGKQVLAAWPDLWKATSVWKLKSY